ncbi:hypothetical protein ABID56_002553 [Alkalibacillus flavidus]|uniref:DUF4358 domain-containing protein n=1 Tax=Alkalibacillus flavidus TaxID=546021 RepID=A0ABV2L0S4_9BACI
MKRLQSVILPILITLMFVGCSNENNSSFPMGYGDFVSEEERTYSLLVVKEVVDGKYGNPEFLKEHNEETGKVLNTIHYKTLKHMKERNQAEIKSAPYFIYFDTDSIVFRTGNPKEAEEFLINSIKEK